MFEKVKSERFALLTVIFQLIRNYTETIMINHVGNFAYCAMLSSLNLTVVFLIRTPTIKGLSMVMRSRTMLYLCSNGRCCAVIIGQSNPINLLIK